jgi:hypothetical protein
MRKLFIICFFINLTAYCNEVESVKWGNDIIEIKKHKKHHKSTEYLNPDYIKLTKYNIPLKKRYSLYRNFRYEQIMLKTEKGYIQLNFYNIGKYCQKLNGVMEFCSLINILIDYYHFYDNILNYDMFQKVYKEVETGRWGTFLIINTNATKLLNKKNSRFQAFKKGEYFYCSFLYFDKDGVVQYKFIMDNYNQIGFIRHVLIKYPKDSRRQGMDPMMKLEMMKIKKNKIIKDYRVFIHKLKKARTLNKTRVGTH